MSEAMDFKQRLDAGEERNGEPIRLRIPSAIVVGDEPPSLVSILAERNPTRNPKRGTSTRTC
jgi:hypothetical protein